MATRTGSLLRAAAAAAVALGLSTILAPTAAAQSILDPASESAAGLKRLYEIMFVLGVIVFFLVEGLILFAALRFRRRGGDDEEEPEQVHGSTKAEVAWTVAPAIVVLALAAVSYRPILEQRNPPADSLQVDVTGKQWFWEFAYPDGDVVTANELVLPVGRPVTLRLASADVIHSFWAPQLAGKMDVIPGDRQAGYGRNELWFVPDREGEFWGQCAELCGTQHAGMRFVVRVVSEAEFASWLEAQSRPAVVPRAGSIEAEGRDLTARLACRGCHVIDGEEGMVGRVGPDLTHVASRRHLAGAVFENTPDNLRRWIDHPDDLKVGSKMPDIGLTEEQAAAIAAYLSSLE